MVRVVTFIMSCLLCVSCGARTIIVDNDHPADFNNIQTAIDSSSEGDIIEVQPGTYKGHGNRDIDFKGKSITICSAAPDDSNIVAATIIDCNGEWLNGHRGFYFHNDEDSNSILDGLTIRGGLAWGSDGGGILIENSSPMVRNCVISGNSAHFNMVVGGRGGGICLKNSNAKIINCQIAENSSEHDYGGGISCINNSSPTINDCIIVNNSSDYGGGISCEGDNSCPLIINCTVLENSAFENGAGIYCFASNPTIQNCTISGNAAGDGAYGYGHGGGIGINEGNPVIKNCVISGNYASVSGGGIYSGTYENLSNLSVTNCTIVQNYAGYNDYGTEGGGGIACYYTSANITNSILWNNTAVLSGPQIAIFTNPSWPSTLRISYCNIQGGQTDVYGSTLIWQANSIESDPYFVQPGYWVINPDAPEYSNNRVWINTNSDYHLKSEGWRFDIDTGFWTWDNVTSRCIDAGNPGCNPVDEPLSNDYNRINMGAYGGTAQASIPPHNWALLADLNNDGIVNLADYAHHVAEWNQSQECQCGDLNRDGIIDFIDLTLLLDDWLMITTWN